MKTLIRGFILFITVSSSAFAQNPPPDLKELLAKVSEAVRHSNYRGRLTYEHSGKLEVLEISHSVIDGVEHEKVYYLNGPNRVLVKNDRDVSCATQGSRLLSGGVIELDNGALSSIEATYQFKLLGEERVAGRESWVLQLIPRDKYRHSFILAIDQRSYLPTKTLFVANGRKVLERLHFVSLETDVPIIDTETSREPPRVADESSCSDGEALTEGAEWQPGWVPPGFVLSSYRYSDEDGHMETYTDGLASFSVFTKKFDSKNSDAKRLPVATSVKKGATVVVMRLLSEATPVHVSVLGEIPSETANRILASVKASPL